MTEVTRQQQQQPQRFAATVSSHAPWRHPYFLKDAKLRVQERYWRRAFFAEHDRNRNRNSTNANENGEEDAARNNDVDVSRHRLRIIPDGVSWRKYTRLFKALIEEIKVPVQWFLLESAVELLDWRNQSPCINGGVSREAAAPHERSQLQRFVQQRNSTVLPLADLSLRSPDGEDEWDMLEYERMSATERSRHALNRAARMIQASAVAAGTLPGSEAPVWILVDPSDHADGELPEDGIRYVNWGELYDFLRNEKLLSAEEFDKLTELQQVCEREYTKRNSPPTSPNDVITGDKDTVDTQMEYLSADQIEKGLRAGQLVRGRLNVTYENAKEAFVTADGVKYFVDENRRHFNRAFHYDVVALQPLPESQWGRPVGKRRLVHHRDDDTDDNNLSLDDIGIPPVPSARVVGILESSHRVYVATMIDVPSNDESAVLVVPMDIRIPKIRVHTKSWRRFTEQRLLVEIDGWDATSNYPAGRCIQLLGPIADLDTEVSSLLHENHVALDPFSVAALACLPPAGDAWTIPEEEIQRRRDLRQSRKIFSVDPPGCQDIDDAMHAAVLPNGDVEVGVHIADVTYFVEHQSALDKEAQARATTFYLVDRRFDMLPSLLSSNLCSLHGGMDRLAVSVIWTLSSDLKHVKSTWFGRTAIRNCAAMTYDQADNILQGKPPDAPGKSPPPPLTAGGPVDQSITGIIKDPLQTLTLLARKLREDREAIGGAVDLSSGDIGNELKFTLESGQPVKVASKEDKEIHSTIAELMIVANSYVASKIYKSFPDSSLLRIHRTVEEDRFDDLREVLEASGIPFHGENNMALAKSLKDAERLGKSSTVVSSLIKSLATRAMSEAQYVCTGDKDQEADLSHYGLGLSFYTHFTSPIRRYADVIVHKQLLASLEADTRDRELRPINHGRAAIPQMESIPKSKTISVLSGEGITGADKDKDGLIDSLIEGAATLALGPGHIMDGEPMDDESISTIPYQTFQLSKVCEGLNLHNRLAKRSSMECQKLFLSLYFRAHVEVTDAVVVSLRSNGFWVYVPKFDMRGPVYMKGLDNDVQFDPKLLGLPPSAGLPASSGFLGLKSCRRFPGAVVRLDEDRLEVTVPESPNVFVVRALDVVTVQLSCDSWDVRARVPSPRVQLLARAIKSLSSSPIQDRQGSKITSGILNRKAQIKVEGVPATVSKSELPSFSDIISTFRVFPDLENVPKRSSDGRKTLMGRTESMKGRVVYGDFINPDTRSATQEAAQQSAAVDAAQRRSNALEQVARRDEYDKSRSVERMATSRQHRLAADKKSSRHHKSSK